MHRKLFKKLVELGALIQLSEMVLLEQGERAKSRRVFYGWWVIAALDSIGMFTGGVTNTLSAYVVPLCDEFGWTRLEVSAAFSIHSFETGFEGPLIGWLTSKLGPRRVLILNLLTLGVSLLIFSQISSLWSLYLTFALLALGNIYTPSNIVVGNWFNRKIGKAQGFFQAGFGLGGFLVPLLVGLIVGLGWRMSLVVTAVTIFAVCVPLCFIVRDRPESYGLLPDGDAKESNLKAVPQSMRGSEIDFTLSECLRCRSFWLLNVITSLTGFVISAFRIHQIPYLVGIGFSMELAALGVTCATVSGILGRLGFGLLCDRVEKRYAFALCFVLQLLGIVLLINTSNVWLVFLSLAVFGVGQNAVWPVRFSMLRTYFGRKNHAVIVGAQGGISAALPFLGPLYSAWIFDVTSSYYLAFLSFVPIFLVVMVCALLAKPPSGKQRTPASQAPLN